MLCQTNQWHKASLVNWEILSSIKKLYTDRRMGPDGLPVDFTVLQRDIPLPDISSPAYSLYVAFHPDGTSALIAYAPRLSIQPHDMPEIFEFDQGKPARYAWGQLQDETWPDNQALSIADRDILEDLLKDESPLHGKSKTSLKNCLDYFSPPIPDHSNSKGEITSLPYFSFASNRRCF